MPDQQQQLSPSQLANIRLSMEPSQFVLFDRAQLRKTVIALLDHVALTESNDSRDTGDKPSESRVTATDTASERRETDPESNDSRPECVTGPTGITVSDRTSPEHGFVEHDYECPDCGESMGHGSSGGTAIYTAFACGNVREYNRGFVTHTGDCNNPVRGENVPDPTACKNCGAAVRKTYATGILFACGSRFGTWDVAKIDEESAWEIECPREERLSRRVTIDGAKQAFAEGRGVQYLTGMDDETIERLGGIEDTEGRFGEQNASHSTSVGTKRSHQAPIEPSSGTERGPGDGLGTCPDCDGDTVLAQGGRYECRSCDWWSAEPAPEGTLEPSWRVTLDVENQLDELFATNATIHIERMTPHALWMRVNDQVVQVSSAGKLLILTEDDSEHPATEGTP